MNKFLVSIIVPCYNQAQYLEDALQSVLNQTYENWECIIVNDGSPDNTEEIVQKWVLKDSRFLYLKKENGGLSSARNAGIKAAQGEFILPLDADDKISEQYIQLAITEFNIDIDLKVVYCKAEKFGIVTHKWNMPKFSLEKLAKGNLIFCSALYRKKEWELAGGYDVNLIYGLEDWEFWIAILKNGGNVKCLDEVGFYYRIRENSMTSVINSEQRTYSELYVFKKHIEFYKWNYDLLNDEQEKMEYQLRSEKFVINLFTKMFFGFKFFRENQ